MEFNFLVYPAPEAKMTLTQFMVDPNMKRIIHLVNSCNKKGQVEYQIPCVFYDKRGRSHYNNENVEVRNGDRLMIYFHGNAEDVTDNIFFLNHLQNTFNCSVLAMEYPGYGFFRNYITDGKTNENKKMSTSPKVIKQCARSVFQNAIKPISEGGLGFQATDIILFGRSMGSGPASLLAAEYTPRALILVSAYTTVKHAAGQVAGRFLAFFLAEHFNNMESIKKTKCPTMIIHGERDDLIPADHGRDLRDLMYLQPDDKNKQNENFDYLPYCDAKFHAHMTHNDFNMDQDIIFPVRKFLQGVKQYWDKKGK